MERIRMNAIFRYPGSKWGLANWIIDHFPVDYEKMVYLEPFTGSGAVFFNKNAGCIEMINDLDDDIVNVFAVLRDRPEELKRRLLLTPYSRVEYDRSFEPYDGDDVVEKARRYFVKLTQAIGAKMDGKGGWRNHNTPKIGGTAYKWAGMAKNIDEATTRLRGSSTNLVQIEHMDALRLIERYNNPDVLMYLDPPYVMSTRKSGRLYNHEMTNSDHERLIELVVSSKAKIIISGYQSDMYSNSLKGWYMDTKLSQTTSTAKATEVIWTNYEPHVQTKMIM